MVVVISRLSCGTSLSSKQNGFRHLSRHRSRRRYCRRLSRTVFAQDLQEMQQAVIIGGVIVLQSDLRAFAHVTTITFFFLQ